MVTGVWAGECMISGFAGRNNNAIFFLKPCKNGLVSYFVDGIVFFNGRGQTMFHLLSTSVPDREFIE